MRGFIVTSILSFASVKNAEQEKRECWLTKEGRRIELKSGPFSSREEIQYAGSSLVVSSQITVLPHDISCL